MGLLNNLGVSENVPSITKSIDISSFVSNTWVWVLVVVIIGVLLISGVGIFLFLTTYKRKIEVYEGLGGQLYRTFVTRARVVKLGKSGGEIMRTLRGGHYLSSHGKKIAKNTYIFVKASDGYLYNVILGDLDSRKEIIDIEPVDKDVRMFHTALDRLSHEMFGKQSFMEKYGIHIMLFIFLITLILGMWAIIGKIGEATKPLAQSQELAVEVQESNLQITSKLEGIINNLNNRITTPISGIVPANNSLNQT